MECSIRNSQNATLRPEILSQHIGYDCIDPLPTPSSDVQLSTYSSNLTSLNTHIGENVPSTADTIHKIYENNATDGSTTLCEIPANLTRNMSLNTLPSNTITSNQLVLVPLSMLNLPLSNILEISHGSKSETIPPSETELIDTSNENEKYERCIAACKTKTLAARKKAGSQSEAIPPSQGELIDTSNMNEKCTRCKSACKAKILAARKKVRQKRSNSCVVSQKSSRVKKDGGKKGKIQGVADEKRKVDINVGYIERRIQRKRGKMSPKSGSDLKQSVNDRTISESKLCLVCAEKAGKHIYYGGRSCQSCRAFFRRSVETITKYAAIVNILVKIN